MVTAIILTLVSVAATAGEPSHAQLRPVPLTQIEVNDHFWKPRLEVNRQVTLPHNLRMCEETGRISNFAKAGGLMDGAFEGKYYNDSDVYKVLEGAGHILATRRDAAIEKQIDDIIDKIAAAQEESGYINSYYTLVEPDKHWSDLDVKHELYCAGHMFEAAVAYAKATKKTKLLDVACKMADHIDSIFGFGKRMGTPGHEEIELALVKLYQHTGEERYRKLAEFFVAARGTEPPRNKPEYRQAHKPVKEQTEIVGHAVRAMYLYAGVADVAALTGDADYFSAMETIWRDVALRKMYITGGVGARHQGESFGGAYELPNDSAYAETCAGIALGLWNHRLLLLHGEGRFADVLERVLYNALPSSVSLKGDTFFYVNPLASNGQHHRQAWYGTACCPTNIVRVLPQVPQFAYSQTDTGIWVNLYIAGAARVRLEDTLVDLKVTTEYPWDGAVKIDVVPSQPETFSLNLRIPGWCEGATIEVNGEPIGAKAVNGYVAIDRKWQKGDQVKLGLPMPIRRVQANPKVAANRGRVALQRGPIVFCLEAVDHQGHVFNLSLPRDTSLSARFEPELLGGAVVVRGKGLAADPGDWTDKLYQPVPVGTREVDMTGVPYCVWDNREAGEMVVWVPEVPGM